MDKRGVIVELDFHGNEALMSLEFCRIAVIGSYNPSMIGIYNTIKYTRGLVRDGFIIVSGLDRGIDTIVHRTAMEAGGHTIAVLATSFDKVSCSSNSKLQSKIGDEHLLVSQFTGSVGVSRNNLRERDGTMALIADATLVIEDNDYRVVIHQVRQAIRYGNVVFWHRFNCRPPQAGSCLSGVRINTLFNYKGLERFLPQPLKERGIFYPNDMKNLSQFKRPLEWRGLDG